VSGARGPRRLVLPVVLATAALLLLAGPAAAASGPHWSIQASPLPSAFSSAETAECLGNEICDAYSLLVTNVGDEASSGATVIKDSLPAGGVTFFSAEGVNLTTRALFSCTHAGALVECSYPTAIAPGESLVVTISVTTAASLTPLTLEDHASVQGGGASAPASAVVTGQADIGSATLPFGFEEFGMNGYGPGGEPSASAGGHPLSLESSYRLTNVVPPGAQSLDYLPVKNTKSVTVELPFGLIGNPQAVGRCPEALLARSEGNINSFCPSNSRVGTVLLLRSGGYSSSRQSGANESDLYNLTPEPGYPAVFGFRFIAADVLLYSQLIHTPQGYRLRVDAPELPHAVGSYQVIAAILNFFGVPAIENGVIGGSPTAFLRDPTSCTDTPQQLSARIEAAAWSDPEHPVSEEVPVYSGINGCESLHFNPELKVLPQSAQAGAPSGYEVDLRVPQPQLASETATPDLKDATVTLPKGVSLSPAVGDGLEGCAAEGTEGINLGSKDVGGEGQDFGDPEATELGEGHPGGDSSPYDDGLWHAAPGHCPAASQIGEAEVSTPLLESPLHGKVFLAQPTCGGALPACTEAAAEEGKLYGLYLEIDGSGIIVKLHGTVEVGGEGGHNDLAPGQLRTRFDENPQLPFEELKLTLNGGPRAPLANPPSCGTYTATSMLEPWSHEPGSGELMGTPNATPSAGFKIDQGCEAPAGFDPGFEAGSTNPVAGKASSFSLKITAPEGEPNLSRINVILPPGELAKLAGVPLCPDAAAASGACDTASQIGSTTVAVGAGPSPLWVPQSGKSPTAIYLAGPYKGAPYSLVIKVPAQAGPFDLGDVITRAGIYIDPETTQVTVKTDPLPQTLDGIPLAYRTIYATIDRPNFTLNPTSCAPLSVGSSLAAANGASAGPSDRFQVADCASLQFKPKFTASTNAKTSKAAGASLKVRVAYPPGSMGTQANIKSVKVELPKSLPSRLTTLQKACTAKAFEANPASCPAESVIGHAIVDTQLLSVPLEGPAYFVSHGGEAFPNLIMVLQGDGVTVELIGDTLIKNGVTSSTFKSTPDVPFESFELTLPQGKYSALTANGNLCQQNLVMPTVLTAQNGATLNQNTHIETENCTNVLSIVSKKLKGRTLILRIAVPGAGKIKAGGKGLSGETKNSDGREIVTIHLRVKKHGKTHVKISFAPKSGKKQSKTLSVRA
jgi:hypothetical protein